MIIRNLLILVVLLAVGLCSGCTSAKDKKEANNKQIAAALELAHQDKYPEAAEILKKVISSDPESFEAHSNLGSMYVRMNKIKEAIASFETAKKIRPGVTISYYNIGGAYITSGELDKATEAFNELNKKFPQETDGSFGLALVAMERKQYPEAIRILEELDKKKSNNMPILFSLAVSYSMTGNNKKAQECKSRIQKIDGRLLPQLEATIKLTREKK